MQNFQYELVCFLSYIIFLFSIVFSLPHFFYDSLFSNNSYFMRCPLCHSNQLVALFLIAFCLGGVLLFIGFIHIHISIPVITRQLHLLRIYYTTDPQKTIKGFFHFGSRSIYSFNLSLVLTNFFPSLLSSLSFGTYLPLSCHPHRCYTLIETHFSLYPLCCFPSKVLIYDVLVNIVVCTCFSECPPFQQDSCSYFVACHDVFVYV